MYCGENENYVFEDEDGELWAVAIPCESNLEKFYNVTPSMIKEAKEELVRKAKINGKNLVFFAVMDNYEVDDYCLDVF